MQKIAEEELDFKKLKDLVENKNWPQVKEANPELPA